jgi:hypothetical protein
MVELAVLLSVTALAVAIVLAIALIKAFGQISSLSSRIDWVEKHDKDSRERHWKNERKIDLLARHLNVDFFDRPSQTVLLDKGGPEQG